VSWVIEFNTPLSEKISRRTLSGSDWKGLLQSIEEVRARVGREMGRAVEVVSCYEAGYDGFWLHRQLEAHGARNYVIDPASLKVDRRVKDGSDRRRSVIALADGVSARRAQGVERSAGARHCRRGRSAAAPRA
jgi:transposase